MAGRSITTEQLTPALRALDAACRARNLRVARRAMRELTRQMHPRRNWPQWKHNGLLATYAATIHGWEIAEEDFDA